LLLVSSHSIAYLALLGMGQEIGDSLGHKETGNDGVRGVMQPMDKINTKVLFRDPVPP